MAGSGSGTITPIPVPVPGPVPSHPGLSNVITAVGELQCTDLAVPLPLYAQVVGYDECRFFGIHREDAPAVVQSQKLWIKSERDYVAHYLSESQAEIEQVCRYPLKARWIEDEEHDYEFPVLTRWTRVVEAGIPDGDSIDEDAPVSHATDPATVGPMAVTFTDEEEVYVYHPDTCVRIYPNNIDITGGQLTIEIPRARLLTEAGHSVTGGVAYDDTGAPAGMYEQAVDVVRISNDNSTEAVLRWSHGTTTCASCSGTTDTGCMTVIDGEIGEIDVLPASYSGGSWTRSSWTCYCHYPDRMQLNYRAGLLTLTPQARDAIIRLAHAKMPSSPCNVDPPNYMWSRDKNVPRALTRERVNCPFGLEDGAWVAYRFATAMKVVRGSLL